MSALLAAMLVLAHQRTDSTAAYEGIWINDEGSVLFAGNGRIDWRVDDRFYSALPDLAPDGALLGTYVAGKELLTPLGYGQKDTDPLAWSTQYDGGWRDGTGRQHLWISHLGPDARTIAAPEGEVRVNVDSLGANGAPKVIVLASVAPGGRLLSTMKFVRAHLPMASLGLEGKYGDKDESLVIEGDPGRTGAIHGSLSYLGKTYSLTGKRIMGRAAFALFDTSRFGGKALGYVCWTPSTNRTPDIREGDATSTDQVFVYFRLIDGSTNTGIHKTLKRTS